MKNKAMLALLPQGIVLALVTSYTSTLLAEPIRPDAGQTLQQLQSPSLPFTPPKPVSPIQIDEKTATEIVTDNQPTFLVKRIRVQGNTAFSAQQLESLLVSLAGSEQTMSRLNDAAKLITRFYRHHGYPVARAYVPAQTITDGEVTINVLEGKLGNITLNNHAFVNSSIIDRHLHAHLTAGEILTTDRLNQALLLLNDVPGVGRSQGALQAGKAVGLSDLSIHVPADKRWQGEVMLDNYGSRFTGQKTLSGHTVLNSPLNIGDKLDIRAMLSEDALMYGRVSWDAPIGYEGLRAGVAMGYSRYELGDIFSPLAAQGSSQTLLGFMSYPVLLNIQNRVSTTFTLRQRNLEDEIGLLNSQTDKNAQDVVLGFGGSHLSNRQTLSWLIEGTMGQLSIETPAALAIDAASAQTDGSYAKLTTAVRALKAVSETISLYLAFNAQASNTNLDTSEKFSLGGIYGVRAYPSAEAAGDEGWLATLEVRGQVLPTLQLFALHDTGGIRVNHQPFAATANTRRLSGSGLGFQADFSKQFSLTVTAAWRGDEAARADQDERPRVWAQGKYQF